MTPTPASRLLVGYFTSLTLLVALYCLFIAQQAPTYPQFDPVTTPFLTHETTIRPQLIKFIDQIDIVEIADVFDSGKDLVSNHHIEKLLKCDFKPNPVTNAIRIQASINNISLVPPKVDYDHGRRYFNPTLIPLPSYSPYTYLLLSRLVTAGLHQESHICLATICIPRDDKILQILPAGARYCDESDFRVLGPQGGIRCATIPERLNIPPTPAHRCFGAWAAFPDIPGFHDPRIFWSGKREPLVILNSASRYACVGLWVVDLRTVYSELEQLLAKEGNYAGLGNKRGNNEMQAPARMSYPHLTELARNPRGSRGVVEKNWIMFFPKKDESWVQYDLVAHGGHSTKSDGNTRHMDEFSQATMNRSIRRPLNESLWENRMPENSVASADNANTTELVNSTPTAAGLVSRTNRNTSAKVVDENERFERSAADNHDPVLLPSRSFAKLIGSGYSTSNLTASNEAPCLTSRDLLDATGKRGQWHQGSNSLRLILCSRTHATCLSNKNESALVDEGKVVHFAILHRKFSNNLDLPMRYERYIMVWEARYPFRMLGISQHPILFAGEKAQPWSDDENELNGDEEAARWKGVYFTYSPSLAWSWRKESVMDDMGSGRVGLGTGFLGDEVIVGIGMDDIAQGFVRIKVEELLSCLRLCPDFAQNNTE